MTGSTVRGAFTDELTRLAQMDRTLFALATDGGRSRKRGSATVCLWPGVLLFHAQRGTDQS